LKLEVVYKLRHALGGEREVQGSCDSSNPKISFLWKICDKRGEGVKKRRFLAWRNLRTNPYYSTPVVVNLFRAVVHLENKPWTPCTPCGLWHSRKILRHKACSRARDANPCTSAHYCATKKFWECHDLHAMYGFRHGLLSRCTAAKKGWPLLF
jgi:hypothetical protein